MPGPSRIFRLFYASLFTGDREAFSRRAETSPRPLLDASVDRQSCRAAARCKAAYQHARKLAASSGRRRRAIFHCFRVVAVLPSSADRRPPFTPARPARPWRDDSSFLRHGIVAAFSPHDASALRARWPPGREVVPVVKFRRRVGRQASRNTFRILPLVL